MLHLNTIDKTMHAVLISLLGQKYLIDFSLVGGTSLSLRYGHRKSIDIDLFSPKEFDPLTLDELLKADYPNYTYRGNNKSMPFCDIGPVKADIIYHPFKMLLPTETIDNIRMFSVKDVAAMKLYAICRRGTKKDFYDLWALLQEFTPQKLINLFIEKYGEDQLIFLQKSIVYYEEADNTEQQEFLIKNLTWEKVKKTIYQSFVNL